MVFEKGQIVQGIPFKKGMTPWNKGKHHSEETKLKISISRKGILKGVKKKPFTEEHKRNISIAKKKYKCSEETKEKLRKFNLGKKLSEEHKIKIGNTNRGKKRTENSKLKMRKKHNWKISKDDLNILIKKDSIRFKKMWENPIYRENKINQFKKIWQDENWKEKQIKLVLKSLFETRPTSLERQFIDIINKYNLPYKYTGDGSFLVGYKNPDFININGEKICIEVANDIRLHHTIDYPEKRKEHFAKYGWRCIVFMTNKLDENKVVEELKKEGIISE